MSTKRKAPSKIAAPVVRSSAKLPTKAFVDESRATVTTSAAYSAKRNASINGRLSENQTIPDSDNDVESNDDDSDEEVGDAPTGDDIAPAKQASDSAQTLQDPSANPDLDSESDAEGAPPTFGDLVRGQETIDVAASLEDRSNRQLTLTNSASRTALAPPSLSSLGTVLSQALRTDDTDLLESCLSVGDVTTVRNTIERLDSSLAGLLLTALASRLHRRPGRAGTLMQWVQWTLIAHGGALASQPEVLSRLSALQRVLAERARGLDSLLILKGKLDMLEAQMTLRRHIHYGNGASQQDEGDDTQDENVIWVEGQPDGAKGSSKQADADDGEPVELPSMNGIIGGSDDEEEDEDEDEDSDEGDEEDDDKSLDEAEVDHDDVDESMGEDDDSDAEAAPPRKVQKVAKGFSKGR